MKKMERTLGLVLFALLTGSLTAQTSFILSPEIGIHSSKSKPTGDLDISEFFQGMDVGYSGVFSYQGGISFGVQLYENWALLTGIKYNQKGGKVSVETRDPNTPFIVTLDDGTQQADLGEVVLTTKHNWLSIPILARAQFGRSIKIGVAIGPQINMGIGKSKESVDYNMENTNLSSEENTYEFGTSSRDVLKKNHVSLLILPYVAYQLNDNGSIKLSMVIERGSDMVNDNYVVGDINGQRNVDGTMSNNQFGVMLSYEHRFDLKAGVKY